MNPGYAGEKRWCGLCGEYVVPSYGRCPWCHRLVRMTPIVMNDRPTQPRLLQREALRI